MKKIIYAAITIILMSFSFTSISFADLKFDGYVGSQMMINSIDIDNYVFGEIQETSTSYVKLFVYSNSSPFEYGIGPAFKSALKGTKENYEFKYINGISQNIQFKYYETEHFNFKVGVQFDAFICDENSDLYSYTLTGSAMTLRLNSINEFKSDYGKLVITPYYQSNSSYAINSVGVEVGIRF